MSVRGYAAWTPKGEAAYWTNRAVQVLGDYQEEWPLSNRQLFYRLVQEHGYDKTEKAYDRLTQYVSRGRRAGLIDWSSIRDGGLGVGQDSQLFDDPDDFIDNATHWASTAQLDRQAGQSRHIELWCEAGGMMPILRSVAHPYGCRANTGGGYDSVTAKHHLALRVARNAAVGLQTLILHVGDFDPSGEDMCAVLRDDAGEMAATQVVRALAAVVKDDYPEDAGFMDVDDGIWTPIQNLVAGEKLSDAETRRVWRFARSFFTVQRVALTGAQVIEGVEQNTLTTAPPKKSDSRMTGFIENNWEVVDALGTEDISAQLEALTPADLRALIREVIEGHLDMDAYREVLVNEDPFRAELQERLSNA
jgi:hypothetical protein